MADTAALEFVARLRDEASDAASGLRSNLTSVGRGLTPVELGVDVTPPDTAAAVAAVRGAAGDADRALEGIGRGVSIDKPNGAPFVAGAKSTGAAAEDALGDTGTKAGAKWADKAGDAVRSGAKKVTAAAGAVGLLAGAALGSQLGTALDVDAARGKLTAQLNLSGPDAKKAGDVAGRLFSGAYGESMGDVNEAIRRVSTDISSVSRTSSADLEKITAGVLDVSTAFDQDLGAVTRATGQLMKTGLAKDSQDALNIITRGFQNGADKSEDFLDTMNEYGTQFRKLGVDGPQAVGLISQGLKAGARDGDIVADSLKEFSIRATEGGKDASAAFDSLGLSSSKMIADVAAGGPRANAALASTLDKLRAVKDPADRSRLAVALFGTQAEDMGDALYALDPGKASKAIGDVGGAADKMGKSLNDNARTNLTSFGRQAQTLATNVLGGTVVPAVNDAARMLATTFGPAVKSVAGFLREHEGTARSVAAALVILATAFGTAWAAAKGVNAVASGFSTIRTGIGNVRDGLGALRTSATTTGGTLNKIGTGAKAGFTGLANGARGAVAALRSGAAAAASFAAAQARAGFAAAAAGVKFLAAKTATLAHAAASRVAAIAQGALNIVMSMNPITLIIIAIIALVAGIVLLWKKNEAFRNFIIGVWNAIKTGVIAVINGLKTGISVAFNAIRGFITRVWNGIKAVTGAVWRGIVTVVRTYFTVVRTVVTTVVNAVRAVITRVWNGIKVATSAAWGFIRRSISNYINAARAVVTSVVNGVRAVVTRVWSAIRSSTSAAWNAVKSFVTRGINGAKAAVSAGVSAAKTAVSTAWNAVKTATSAAWNAVSTAVRTAIDKVIALARGIKGRVLGAVSGAASWLTGIGRNIIDGLVNGVKGAAGRVNDAVQAIVGKIPKVIREKLGIASPSKVMIALFRWVPEGAAIGITRSAGKVTKAARRMVESVVKASDVRGVKFPELVPDDGRWSTRVRNRAARAKIAAMLKDGKVQRRILEAEARKASTLKLPSLRKDDGLWTTRVHNREVQKRIDAMKREHAARERLADHRKKTEAIAAARKKKASPASTRTTSVTRTDNVARQEIRLRHEVVFKGHGAEHLDEKALERMLSKDPALARRIAKILDTAEEQNGRTRISGSGRIGR